MNNPQFIEKSWRTFRDEVGLADAPEVQRTEMRRAFYAGAHALFGLMVGISDPGTGPDATEMELDLVDGILDEIRAFQREVAEGRA